MMVFKESIERAFECYKRYTTYTIKCRYGKNIQHTVFQHSSDGVWLCALISIRRITEKFKD